jgi:hypothetical protein
MLIRRIHAGEKVTKEQVDEMYREEIETYKERYVRGREASKQKREMSPSFSSHLHQLALMHADDVKLTIMEALYETRQIEKYSVLKTVDYSMIVPAFSADEAEEWARNEPDGWEHIGTDISVDETPIEREV